MEQLTLREVLGGLASGGLTGTIMFWLLDNWPWLREQAPRTKRLIVLLVPPALGVLAYGAQIIMGYTTPPENTRAIAEILFAIVANIITSQGLHGLRYLEGEA